MELAALLPIVAVVMLAAGQLVAAGQARELAGHAAEAGAVGLIQGGDARAATIAALPGWARERVRVSARGSIVSVHLRPRTLVPGLDGLLAADVRADAGTEAGR